MNNKSEELINTWLRLSAIIRNERFTKFFTFREISVCNILYNYEKNNMHVTATTVTLNTGMLKSQTNKVLNSLLDKKCIEIKVNANDKRQKILKLTPYGKKKYLSEHSAIVKIMSYLTSDMKDEEITRLCNNINHISQRFNTIQNKLTNK